MFLIVNKAKWTAAAMRLKALEREINLVRNLSTTADSTLTEQVNQLRGQLANLTEQYKRDHSGAPDPKSKPLTLNEVAARFGMSREQAASVDWSQMGMDIQDS